MAPPPQPERLEPPKLTVGNLLADIRNGAHDLIYNPFCLRLVAPLVVVGTLLACKLIIFKVPYTEIDFSTYMQQIDKVNNGEIDYREIYGDLGPMVYPGGFVSVYKVILSLTDGGKDLELAQHIFLYVLVVTNLLVSFIYGFSGVAPWCLAILLLSKRIFSIYVLRMFNDCFTTLGMVAVTFVLQQAASWAEASPLLGLALAGVAMDLYLLAVLVKMNALLYLPAVLVATFFLCGENTLVFLGVCAIFPLIQVVMGWNYLVPHLSDAYAKELRRAYIDGAFDFKRKFLFKWTVNWRFVGSEVFSSDGFAKGLLAVHVVVLLFFAFTRFLSPKITRKTVPQLVMSAVGKKPFISGRNWYLTAEHGPRLIMLLMSTTNLIGVVCARSLHYQFLLWYFWQLPFMLWATGWPLPVNAVLWVAHEVCWNVFPSTEWLLALLVTILTLVLIGVWRNTAVWFPVAAPSAKKNV